MSLLLAVEMSRRPASLKMGGLVALTDMANFIFCSLGILWDERNICAKDYIPSAFEVIGTEYVAVDFNQWTSRDD